MGRMKQAYMETLEMKRLGEYDEVDAEHDAWLASMEDMESERFAKPAPLAEEVEG